MFIAVANYLTFSPLFAIFLQISATVATDHKYLPELSIVIHPISYPHKPLIRHRFSSQPRFFSLLGSQVESLIG